MNWRFVLEVKDTSTQDEVYLQYESLCKEAEKRKDYFMLEELQKAYKEAKAYFVEMENLDTSSIKGAKKSLMTRVEALYFSTEGKEDALAWERMLFALNEEEKLVSKEVLDGFLEEHYHMSTSVLQFIESKFLKKDHSIFKRRYLLEYPLPFHFKDSFSDDPLMNEAVFKIRHDIYYSMLAIEAVDVDREQMKELIPYIKFNSEFVRLYHLYASYCDDEGLMAILNENFRDSKFKSLNFTYDIHQRAKHGMDDALAHDISSKGYLLKEEFSFRGLFLKRLVYLRKGLSIGFYKRINRFLDHHDVEFNHLYFSKKDAKTLAGSDHSFFNLYDVKYKIYGGILISIIILLCFAALIGAFYLSNQFGVRKIRYVFFLIASIVGFGVKISKKKGVHHE